MRLTNLLNNLSQKWLSHYWIRVLTVNLLIWGSIVTIGAWGSYLDNVKSEKDLLFSDMLMSWVENDFPLFVLSSCLYPLLHKYPHLVTSVRNVVAVFACLSIVYFPLHMLFRSFANWTRFNEQRHHSNFIDYVLDIRNSSLFFHFGYFAASVLVVIAVRIWQVSRARQQTLLQIQTDYLKLDLALEKQRINSLRQQLEPHFIFNALSGISALVRSDEKTVALNGIHRLSELLRYASKAISLDWSNLHDELAFIRDYLALQQLRYGQRLEVNLSVDVPEILHADCPPLLLQPLVENALRHDLDCHENLSVIDIALHMKGNQIHIQIQNAIHAHASSNPGLGLGLSQTKERLALMYRGLATLAIAHTNDRFVVNLSIPKFRPES